MPELQKLVDMIRGQRNAEEHVDSSRLKSFAEEELTERERKDVLQHLAACVRCRGFLALITPEEGPPTLSALSRRTRQR